MAGPSAIELEVLRGVAAGESAPETAARLHRSPHTILSHRKHLRQKLEARNMAQAVAHGYERGIL